MACRSALSLPRVFAILAAILLICVLVRGQFARHPGGRKGLYNMNGQSPRVVLGIGYDYPRHDNFQILNVTTSCSEYCSGMFVYIRFYDDFRGKLTLLADQNETLCQHEWDNKRARFYVPFFGCGTTEEIVTFDHFKREVIYEYRNVIFLEERPPEKEDALNKQYYPHHNLPYKGVTRQIEIFCRVWESQREDMLEDLNDFRAELYEEAKKKAEEDAEEKKKEEEDMEEMKMKVMMEMAENKAADMDTMMMNPETMTNSRGAYKARASLPPQKMQYPTYTGHGREKLKSRMKQKMAPPQRAKAEAPNSYLSHMSLMAAQYKQQQALNASQLYNPYTRAPHQMTSTTANPYSYINAYSMSGQAAVSLPVSSQPQGHRSKRAAGYPKMQHYMTTTMPPKKTYEEKIKYHHITVPYKPYLRDVCTLLQKVFTTLGNQDLGEECIDEVQCPPRANCHLDPYDGRRKCICGPGSQRVFFREPLYEHDANDFGYLAYQHHGYHDRLFGGRKLPDGFDRGIDSYCSRNCDGSQCKGNPCYTNLNTGEHLCLCGSTDGVLDVKLSC